MHLVSGVSSSDDGDTGSVTPPAGSAPKCDECLAGRGTRKFGWGNRNIRFKTSTGVSVEFTPSDLAGKPTLMFADAGNFTRIENRQVSQHIPNQFKLNYYHTEYQHQIKTLHLEFTWDHGYLHSWVLRKCSPYSIDVTNENALWDWGQGKDYTAGMQGKDRPAIHRAFITYKQIEINHKSYIWVWKKSEGKVCPGRRFTFHSWEHWCDQSQGIENIMRREAGAGSLYSPNLLSCQLSDVNISEFPSAPFSMRDHFFYSASAFLPDPILQVRWPFQTRTLAMMVQQYFCTGVEVTQKSWTAAPVSAGCAVCLQWEWKQPVIHD